MTDGILEKIFERIDTVAAVQEGIPKQIDDIRSEIKGIAEIAATKAVEKHRRDCTARMNYEKVADRAAQNTGAIETIRNSGLIRGSLIPAARAANRLPKWLKVLIPAIVTAALGALGFTVQ